MVGKDNGCYEGLDVYVMVELCVYNFDLVGVICMFDCCEFVVFGVFY